MFNVGGPGIRVQQFGGGRPRRRPHNHANAAGPQQEQSLGQAFQSLLPLLLLFLLPLLSSLFSGSGSQTAPAFRFESIHPYSQPHKTDRLKIPYWVNPAEVDDYSAKKWRELDKTAERTYVSNLNVMCERERNDRDRLVQEAQGFFYTDRDMLQRARDMEMKNCKRLNELGSGSPRW